MKYPLIKSVLFVSLSTIIGCGGGDDNNQASKPIVPAAPQASKPKAANIPGGTNIGKKTPKKKTPRRSPVASKSLSNVTPDTFFIEKEAPIGVPHEIVTDNSILPSENLFAMIPPNGKENSETFYITERPEKQLGFQNPSFQLPVGFTVLEEYGYSGNGIPKRILCEKDQAEMVFVPGGLFLQGTDEGANNASPQHTVNVDPFYIDVTEVTLSSYKTYIALAKGSKGRQPEKPLNIDELDESLPALGLDWGQAKRYAKIHGKDLPTEAEWEKAARGVNGFKFPWGNSRAIWSGFRDQKEISAVKTYKNDVSPFGAFDMAGNTKEWCLDWYEPNTYKQRSKSNRTESNPQGPKSINRDRAKVVRGNGPGWLITHREGMPMATRSPMVGFRCVLRVTVPQ